MPRSRAKSSPPSHVPSPTPSPSSVPSSPTRPSTKYSSFRSQPLDWIRDLPFIGRHTIDRNEAPTANVPQPESNAPSTPGVGSKPPPGSKDFEGDRWGEYLITRDVRINLLCSTRPQPPSRPLSSALLARPPASLERRLISVTISWRSLSTFYNSCLLWAWRRQQKRC